MDDPVSLITIKDRAAALNSSGLSTLEDLRRWISKDVDKSIPLLAESSDTAQSLLLALLIAEFCDDAGRSGHPKLATYWRGLKTFPGLVRLYLDALKQAQHERRLTFKDLREAAWNIFRQAFTRLWRLLYNWRRHWADALLIIVLPALLIAVWFRVESAKSRSVQFVAVKSSANLLPFQRINDEVELASVPTKSGAFTSLDQVRGRYALVTLSSGTPILSNQILSAALSNKIQNRAIVTIPLRTGTARDLSPPCEAVLFLSPRETKSGESSNSSPQQSVEVVLLGIDKTGETTTATVAMVKEDLDKLGPLLASHDAFLLQLAR